MQKKKTGIVIAGVLAAVILLVVFYDFFAEKTVFEDTDFAMGAVISQNIQAKNGEEIAEEIVNKINSTENNISWRIESSEIAQLNKNKKAMISEDTVKYLTEIVDVCEKSDGQVDLTVGNLVNAWNIGSEKFRVPAEKELKTILGDVDYKRVSIEKNTVSIGENQSIDLGFAGKGIACDEAKEILQKHKAKKGIISVGGSLCLYGDGIFNVGVRNPLGDINDYMAVLNIQQGFVSTSGNYERFSDWYGLYRMSFCCNDFFRVGVCYGSKCDG